MKSIEMAINKLNLDLNEVRGVRTFTTAVEEYLEAVFHQKFQYGEIKYFNSLIEMSYMKDDDSIAIIRHDDGCRYVWRLEPASRNIPNYHTDYTDGFFNSSDCDQYVEDALWSLYETIVAHGMMRYKKDLLNSH
jgi:hypothetical protein